MECSGEDKLSIVAAQLGMHTMKFWKHPANAKVKVKKGKVVSAILAFLSAIGFMSKKKIL